MVKLYCSEQIAIPETFPNILKTYAKAAIRTQPYDILRWSAAYFRSLANEAPPPVKIRLERECRQGKLTKGYLRALIAQVGKGFFISRCLLQEKWKALCLPEEELLKYLSLCRMLSWPQVHWLRVVAVMAASLCPTTQESMVLICELLSEDVEGGMARLPYWMFKICYIFVSELDCTQQQCFVNGQLVLPWGDLEEPRPMDRLPRVLSASTIKDTIIKSCKAKFRSLNNNECECPVSLTSTASTNFMINAELGDPKELLAKCEDFDTIMLLLIDASEETEGVICKGPHIINEKQITRAQRIEDQVREERERQSELMAENVREFLDQEAFQMLREVGPPWTWLHQFTTNNCNTESYNFVDQGSIHSDVSPDKSSVNSFDFVKEVPIEEPEKSASSSGCLSAEEMEEKKASIESVMSLLVDAVNDKKCDIEKTSSVVSYLKSEELCVLYKAGQPRKSIIDLQAITCIIGRADDHGMTFATPDDLMDHVKAVYLGNVEDFPSVSPKPTSAKTKESIPKLEDICFPCDKVGGPIEVPPEWQETIPKQVEIPPRPPREIAPVQDLVKDDKKDDLTMIFETTVGIPPEQVAKMPKFCFERNADEMILGLIPVEIKEEEAEEEDLGSPISESGAQSLLGYRSDDSDIFPNDPSPPRSRVPPHDADFYCCINPPTLTPKPYVPPAPQFRCTIDPLPGIGPAVSGEITEKFLSYLRERARDQLGLIHPRNFKEECCPYMVDTTMH